MISKNRHFYLVQHVKSLSHRYISILQVLRRSARFFLLHRQLDSRTSLGVCLLDTVPAPCDPSGVPDLSAVWVALQVFGRQDWAQNSACDRSGQQYDFRHLVWIQHQPDHGTRDAIHSRSSVNGLYCRQNVRCRPHALTLTLTLFSVYQAETNECGRVQVDD